MAQKVLLVVCEPISLPPQESNRKPKLVRKIIEAEQEPLPSVVSPKERIKKKKVVSQVRGYESENDSTTTTSGGLMPQFGMK